MLLSGLNRVIWLIVFDVECIKRNNKTAFILYIFRTDLPALVSSDSESDSGSDSDSESDSASESDNDSDSDVKDEGGIGKRAG